MPNHSYSIKPLNFSKISFPDNRINLTIRDEVVGAIGGNLESGG